MADIHNALESKNGLYSLSFLYSPLKLYTM